MASSELDRYNFGEPQSVQNKLPNTIASANQIVPVHKFTFLTGTATVSIIGTHVVATTDVPEHIVPVQEGYHELVLCYTNGAPGVFVVAAYPAGNIQVAYQPIQNRPIRLYYDPVTKLYYVQATV